MNLKVLVLATFAVASTTACGGPLRPNVNGDGGGPIISDPRDSGAGSDAGEDPDDAGTTTSDAGTDPFDAGPVADAGGGADAGERPATNLTVCVLASDGSIDEDDCTRLDDEPPFIPAIDFGTVDQGEQATRRVLVTNLGRSPLRLFSASFDNATFVMVSSLPSTLPTGVPVTLDLVYAPALNAVDRGHFILGTADPAFPTLRIPVSGETTIVQAQPRLCIEPANGVEFGDVIVGASLTEQIVVANCGDVPVTLSRVSFAEVDTAQRDFTVPSSQLSSSPVVIAVGSQRVVDVTYAPTTVNRTDLATLTIATPQLTSTVSIRGRAIDANTTECLFAPLPAIERTPTGSVATGTLVTLDGSGSSVLPFPLPGLGTRVTAWQWAIVEKPAGSSAQLASAAASSTTFRADVSGRFRVSLVVTDDIGCASTPLEHDIQVEAGACAGTRPRAIVLVNGADASSGATVQVNTGASVNLAAASVVASNGGAQLRWYLNRPTSSAAAPTTTTGSASSFTPDVAGRYEAALVVRDALGCEATVLGQVQANAVAVTPKIEVKLQWAATGGDLDLHLLGPQGTPFSATSDCYWQSCLVNDNLDWGAQNGTGADGIRTNDPVLAGDVTSPPGGESISIRAPFDATFTVVGHHFCSRSNGGAVGGASQGPATATITLLVDGVSRKTWTRSLTQRDLWRAGRITVSNNGANVSFADEDSVAKVTESGSGCTADLD